MPFVTQIQNRKTQAVLASFVRFCNRYYVLENDLRLPLRETHTWCSTCFKFTEREDLYSIPEIQKTIDELVTDKSNWHEIDERHRKKYRNLDRKMSESMTQSNIFKLWTAAKQWRTERKSLPRCLECGESTGLIDLDDTTPIRHPAEPNTMLIVSSCHASIGGDFPSPEFYDAEGCQIQPRIAG